MADKATTTPLVNQKTGEELRSYEKIHPMTGDTVNKYKYLEGHPRQYRFDAKEGVFNINGTDKIGRSFSFQPIAWRIFTDNILNMGQKNWCEIFFIDEKNCVSALLFHGYSVDNIFRLIEPLYYDDLTLADVIVEVIAEKKENNNITPKGVYYIASFSYKMADPARTAELKEFATDFKIFRQETLTGMATIKSAYNFYNPYAAGDELEISAGVTRQALNQAVEQHYSSDETAQQGPPDNE